MIAQLRRRHRHAWLTLAAALAVILIAAWSARRPAPLMERLPETLRTNPAP